MKDSFDRWAIVFESKYDRHFIFEDLKLLYFRTKKQAKNHIKENYSFYKRKDLRNKPHCWRTPKAVKVKITVEEI